MLLVGELLAQVLGFVLMAYLARTLGSGGFGVWSFALAVIAYFVTSVEAGTDSWGVREVSHDAGRLRIVLGAILAARLSIAGAAGIVLFAYAVFSAQTAHPMRAWALAFGCLSVAASAIQTSWAYRATERSGPIAIANVVQRIVVVTLSILLVRSASDAPRAILLQGTGELVIAAALLIGMRRIAGRNWFVRRDALARRALREAWPMGASRMVRAAVVAFTIAALAHVSSNSTVGQYGAANRLAMALLTINTLFSMAVLPSIVRACAGGPEGLSTLSAAQRVIVAIYLPIVVGGCWLARPILGSLFGPAFVAAEVPLRILLVALPITALSDNLRSILLAIGRQRDILRAVGGSAVVTIVLAMVLSARYGATGAASAVLIGEVALYVFAARVVRRCRLRPPSLGPLVRPTAAAAGMMIVLFLLGDRQLPTLVGAGAAVYGVLLVLLKGITAADLHTLDAPARLVAPEDAAELGDIALASRRTGVST